MLRLGECEYWVKVPSSEKKNPQGGNVDGEEERQSDYSASDSFPITSSGYSIKQKREPHRESVKENGADE